MKTRYTFLFLLSLLALIPLACRGLTLTSSGGPTAGELVGAESLVAALGKEGYNVTSRLDKPQDFFPEANGLVYDANGAIIQVFDFVSEASAQEAAATISPSGSTIGLSMVTWIEPVHIYSSGDLIVLYAGSDANMTAVLENILGSQIAGN